MPHDLLLKNATVIDPSQNIDGLCDVAIAADRIAAIAPAIDAEARQTVDLSGKYLTPGWIDMHAHVYAGVTTWGFKADALCLATGVTTIVDAGSPGWANFLAFEEFITRPSRTEILTFVHISGIGLTYGPVGEMTDLRYADPERTAFVVENWPEICVGVKVRMGKFQVEDNDLEPLRQAVEAADLAARPLMLHIGPELSLPAMLDLLRPGDIVTHCYKSDRAGPIPDGDGSEGLIIGDDLQIMPQVRQARQRGILFDLGHGGGSFNFRVARLALGQDFPSDVISTDLHVHSFESPVYSMPETASKLLHLGVELPEIVRQATAAPAAAIGRQNELGTLRPGTVADLAAFNIAEGKFTFEDVHDQFQTGARLIDPFLTVRAGKAYWPADLQAEIEEARQRARLMNALAKKDYVTLGWTPPN